MRRTVVTICALLTLAACRGPEPIEPTPSPEPTGTTTAAPDPTVTEPTLPDQARRNTPEGAAAFVGYWVKTFNYAARTGDATRLNAASSNCEPCSGYAEDFSSLAEDRRPSSDPWRIERVRVSTTRDPVEVFTRIRVLRSAGGTERFDLVFRLSANPQFKVTAIRGTG